jgi:adenine-specific DNA-methyltransferase
MTNKENNLQGMENNSSQKKGFYTQYSDKIGLFNKTKKNFIKQDNDVVINFPFKDCVLEGGMSTEEAQRDERFLHIEKDAKDIDTLFDQKVLTNFSYIDKLGETKLDESSDVEFFDKNENLKNNLLIKGNNLLALHTLKSRLAGRVKLIYIDPPYNTGGDANIFTYNNAFNHSTWMVFMKNRLEIAREFLREDGFIAIAIDHEELFYLGVLADETFGRNNRIGIVTIVHKPEGRNQEKFFATSCEFMLVYAKNKDFANFKEVVLSDEKKYEYSLKDEIGQYKLVEYLRGGGGDDNLRINKPHFYYPIYVSSDLKNISTEKKSGFYEIYPITLSGIERTWKTKVETLIEKINNDRIVAIKNKNKIIICEKYYSSEKGQLIKTHWDDKRYNAINQGTNLLEKIIGSRDFSYPKSLYLVLDTLKIMTSDNDIIMDFFAGSGTTGHATLELNKEDGGNRKFVMIEQLDTHFNICKKRISKILPEYKDNIGAITFELKKYNQEYVDQIRDTKTKEELNAVYQKMMKNAFLEFWINKKNFERDEEYKKLRLEEQKEKLIEILDANQLYTNYLDMNDKAYNVSETDKILTDKFYGEDK